MKILLFEDDLASIESAKVQFAEHELDIITTCFELNDKFDSMSGGDRLKKLGYELILTDMNVKIGELVKSWPYSVCEHFQASDEFPAGLVLALRARDSEVRCLMLTDSNSHRDMLGFLLDQVMLSPAFKGNKKLLGVHTRPEWVKTPKGKGKDWAKALEWCWPETFPKPAKKK